MADLFNPVNLLFQANIVMIQWIVNIRLTFVIPPFLRLKPLLQYHVDGFLCRSGFSRDRCWQTEYL